MILLNDGHYLSSQLFPNFPSDSFHSTAHVFLNLARGGNVTQNRIFAVLSCVREPSGKTEGAEAAKMNLNTTAATKMVVVTGKYESIT